jgi:hypothetical protein
MVIAIWLSHPHIKRNHAFDAIATGPDVRYREFHVVPLVSTHDTQRKPFPGLAWQRTHITTCRRSGVLHCRLHNKVSPVNVAPMICTLPSTLPVKFVVQFATAPDLMSDAGPTAENGIGAPPSPRGVIVAAFATLIAPKHRASAERVKIIFNCA